MKNEGDLMKAIINAKTYDFNNYKEKVYILFDRLIKKIGPMSEFNTIEKELLDKVIDASGAIVMPGLINGHTHIYSSLSRGMNLPFNPKSFTEILEQLWWKLDGVLVKDDCYISAIVYGLESIKCGVTTLIDHHASGGDILGTLEKLQDGICRDLGMRGIFCFETSDRFDVEKCLDENINFSKIKNNECSSLFGMHASMTLSNETLDKISERKGKLPIHIHVAESMEDEVDSINKYKKTIVERLEEYKLLTKNSLLAHCVHINEYEAKLLKAHNVYVALNPTSNMNNAVGLPDYNLLKTHGIPCIIGNDGLGANITREFLNLTYSMKNKYSDPGNFNFSDLLELINNGYEYVSNHLGIKIGKIEEGYVSDLIIVPYNSPTCISDENIFAHIFFGVFDRFTPRDVICNGKLLMENDRPILPFEDIYEKSVLTSKKIWNILK